LMDTGERMASEAAATAPKAEDVALGKSTVLLCPKSEDIASAFSHVGSGH
jgi:hypothetical protein